MGIKHILKNVTTPELRVKLKKWGRHTKALFKAGKKTSINELRDVLTGDLGLRAGDRIVVASSFGNLNAADYTPQDVVKLLMEIVTEDGGIMMPYYPPTNSTVWAKEGRIFDMIETKSGMGVMTNVFSKMPGVVKSVHPTKAVCIWGKDAENIAAGHENSTTPYYWDSPYGKYLKLGCKSIGLGLQHIPIGHAIEDVLAVSPSFYYQKEPYSLKVLKSNGEQIDVQTLVHDEKIIDGIMPLRDYVESLQPMTYQKVKFGMGVLYSVDNTDLFEEMRKAFAKGYTRQTATGKGRIN